MNEETLTREIRRFLKKVGITSQQQIEAAVAAALQEGRIQGTESLPVTVTLEIPALGLSHRIEGTIRLEEQGP